MPPGWPSTAPRGRDGGLNRSPGGGRQAVLHGLGGKLGQGPGAQERLETLEVLVNRGRREVELAGHLGDVQSAGEEAQQFGFAGGDCDRRVEPRPDARGLHEASLGEGRAARPRDGRDWMEPAQGGGCSGSATGPNGPIRNLTWEK